MICCKKCGYRGAYTGRACPQCNEPVVLSEADIAEARRELEVALRAGDAETAVENFKLLSDFGDTAAQREYAKLLEKGSALVPRDVDKAGELFLAAAKKSDAYSAYRYSRIISRINEKISRFWLLFSAALGCEEAYLAAADTYAKAGQNAFANCYYYLSAEGGEADAIVKLATRYYNGDGIEKSEGAAKWYMDKFTFPPLHAIKLSYKLRGVKAEEPPRVTLDSYDGLLGELIEMAKALGFTSAVTKLYTMLAERGSHDAMCTLAEHYLSNPEEKNVDEAMRVLSHAAATGSERAYLTLGILYRDGTEIAKSLPLALDSFKHAAALGSAVAYEYMGDIYHAKEYDGRDIALACELYDRASAGGCESAGKKADGIRAAREGYFNRALAVEETDALEAFSNYYVSALMGYPMAFMKLGECYALGLGTEKSRRDAFVNYSKALALGVKEANLPLGVCYARGIGTAFSFELAVKHLTAALKDGEVRAKRELRRIYENKRRRLAEKMYSTAMRLIFNKKFTIAAQYLASAVKLSHARATYTLGALFEFGAGVKADRARAYELYNEAARLGFKDTRSAYKSFILKSVKKKPTAR